MLLLLCITLLVMAIFDKPIDKLLGKIKGLSWKEAISDSWNNIVRFSKKAGRDITRTALIFYYTLKDGDLSVPEKAILYAGIVYVIVPADFLPRRIMGLFGLLDDVAVAAWIYNRIQNHISDSIVQKAEGTLNDWFGPEIIYSPDMPR